MMNFLKAVYTLIKTINAFNTAIGGRVYYGEAPQEGAMPYAVYFGLPFNEENSFTEDLDDVSFQINVYSDLDSPLSSGDIIEKARALLDGATLTVTGADPITLMREIQTPPWKDGDNWVSTITFNGFLEAT